MIDIQKEIFQKRYNETGWVSLRQLPTVKQIEDLLTIEPDAEITYLTSLDVQHRIHHWNSHKNIFKRGLNNE